jgi:serine/threonine-protein kinase
MKPAPAATPPAGPMIIGRYALFDEIASGGMASVYFGRLVGAAGFSRQVAIKRLHAHLAAEPNARSMFIDEARIAARIHHPNVVSTLDVVNHGNELLLVMDYVHGESLGRLLLKSRKLGEEVPVPVALAIVTDLLHGLHAAHEAKTEEGEPLNIVHRDVSPQNVVVGRDGVARAIDFGIAHAKQRIETTADGLVRGKLSYMSPEQLSGEKVTRATDIFAAGVILWEMITGKRLLGGDDQKVMTDLLRGKFESPRTLRPSIDPAIDAIVMCALEYEPNDRFATANEMARTLEGAGMMATATEVGEWVQHLAQETLSERARKLSSYERLRTGAIPPAPLSRDEIPMSSLRAPSTSRGRVRGLAIALALAAVGLIGAEIRPALAIHHEARAAASNR